MSLQKFCCSAWISSTIVATAIGCASTVLAQMPGQGVQHAVYAPQQQEPGPGQVRSADFVDAYGNSAIVPASFAAHYGAAGACSPDGIGYGLESNMGSPYGYPVDQCGPHYFDFAVEYLNYDRDNGAGNAGPITSLNIGGPIVLSGDSISDNSGPGFRLTGRYDIGPLSVLEASYMAAYDMGSAATFTDPLPATPTQGNLYTAYTSFGTNPVGGGGFVTEQAVQQAVSFDSDLQTAEITYRRYWVGWCPQVTGTLLAGFRYTRLSEDLTFRSFGSGTYSTTTSCDNDLAGFQTGGDMWMTIRQGLRIGTELKGGIFNNRYESSNNFTGADIDSEYDAGNNIAFLSEARVMFVADVLPSLSIKGGYEVLFIESVALAGDNFNTANPFNGRVASFSDEGEVTFYGWSAGLEYVW